MDDVVLQIREPVTYTYTVRMVGNNDFGGKNSGKLRIF